MDAGTQEIDPWLCSAIVRGFTLIELLVVITVIALLLAPLAARRSVLPRSGARAQCASNLRQFGLAGQLRQPAVQSFPAGMASWQGYEFSAQIMLLPYLEQRPLYNSYNFQSIFVNGKVQGPFYNGPAQTTAVNTTVAIFLCPSDIDRCTAATGHNNYMGCAGSAPNSFLGGTGGGDPAKVTQASGPSGGIFLMIGGNNQQNSTTRLSNIRDSTSQTAAFSERVKGITNAGQPDPLKPTSQASTVPDPAPDDTSPEPFHKVCLAHSPTNPGVAPASFGDPSGISWFEGYSFCTRYNHVMPPNTWGCVINAFPRTFGYGALPASSRHPGGVNVLFADSSVAFIKDSVSVPIWWALGTKAGGEIVSQDAF